MSVQQILSADSIDYPRLESASRKTQIRKLTESGLSRQRPFKKLIECLNKLLSDVWPPKSTTLESYPKLRMRTFDSARSFDNRSLGQQMPCFVHVSRRWPLKPWTKMMLSYILESETWMFSHCWYSLCNDWNGAFEEGVITNRMGDLCCLTRCRGSDGSSTGSENTLNGLHWCRIRTNLTRVSGAKAIAVKNSNKGREGCESTPYLLPRVFDVPCLLSRWPM